MTWSRARTELPAIRVPCQVEPKVFEDLRMLASGDSPRSDISLVFHFKDLERLGLVDATTGDASSSVPTIGSPGSMTLEDCSSRPSARRPGST